MASSAKVDAGLSIGGIGGLVVYQLSVRPLPWMLGALTATMTASVADRPIPLRPGCVAMIGVLLEPRFTPMSSSRSIGC